MSLILDRMGGQIRYVTADNRDFPAGAGEGIGVERTNHKERKELKENKNMEIKALVNPFLVLFGFFVVHCQAVRGTEWELLRP